MQTRSSATGRRSGKRRQPRPRRRCRSCGRAGGKRSRWRAWRARLQRRVPPRPGRTRNGARSTSTINCPARPGPAAGEPAQLLVAAQADPHPEGVSGCSVALTAATVPRSLVYDVDAAKAVGQSVPGRPARLPGVQPEREGDRLACREAERAALVSAGRDALPARPGGNALHLGRGLADRLDDQEMRVAGLRSVAHGVAEERGRRPPGVVMLPSVRGPAAGRGRRSGRAHRRCTARLPGTAMSPTLAALCSSRC